MPQFAKAAVMKAPGAPLELMEYPLLPLEPGCLLAQIRCTTICGSDIHSFSGKREAPLPIILGHEITGEIAEMSNADIRDIRDKRLKKGDRITWTLADSCGRCFYCREKGLPMKCRSLKKYGHESCDQPPYLQGGFAEYCVITPGTSIVKIPDAVTDAAAAPANCALATVMAGFEAGGVAPFENILVLGAGALGFYASALHAHTGAAKVIAADLSSKRLEKIKQFGATHTIHNLEMSDDEFVKIVRDLTNGLGVDCVLEVAGAPQLIPLGLQCLRVGGKLVEIGVSFPHALFTYDASDIMWRRLTIKGVHNYAPKHLQAGVDFLEQAASRFAFHEIVTHGVSLEDVNTGLELAKSDEAIRVAVWPE